MKVKNIFIFGIFFLVSCIRIFSLDGFLFGPTKIDEYLQPSDLEEWIEPVVLTSMENKIYGFFVTGNPDSSVNKQVTILYCHGKDENINREWSKTEHLWEMGYNVFIFDYQGYGKSEGEPSGDALFSDGEVSLSHLQSRTDINTTKIVFYGWSLGSFVATYLASDIYHPAALILESAPASVTALLHDAGLINLPGSYVADADFDNERRISNIQCPLFMMHGKEDDFAVLDRHFPLIWENAEEPKDSLLVDRASHDDIPDKLGDSYHQEIIGFINQYVLNP